MHIVTVLPHQKQLGKGHSKRLSRKARHRLEIIDWYNQVSERKSRTGLKDASLTCRHFGIERSYFYRWYGRFKKHGIAGLENRTSRPKRVRRDAVGAEIVEETRRIRQKNPTYSAKKIRPILLRYYEEHEVPCRSTISNVIKRHNFFFRADTKPFKRRSKSGVGATYILWDMLSFSAVWKDLYLGMSHGLGAITSMSFSSEEEWRKFMQIGDLCLGMGVQIPTGILKKVLTTLAVYVDYDNFTSLFNRKKAIFLPHPLLNLSAGLEAVLFKTIALRFGMSGPYLAAGAGINLGPFHLSMSIYGKEKGIDPGASSQVHGVFALSFYY